MINIDELIFDMRCAIAALDDANSKRVDGQAWDSDNSRAYRQAMRDLEAASKRITGYFEELW